MDPYPSVLTPLNPDEIDGILQSYYEQYSFGQTQSLATNPNTNSSASIEADVNKGDVKRIEDRAINAQGNHHQGSSKQKARRCSKADRHSKISTAQGLRDRRMRLSLDVATQFFKLQDLLSYDKASKTVKWLLEHSKSAIEELKEGKQSSSRDGRKSSPPSRSDSCDVSEMIKGEIIANGNINPTFISLNGCSIAKEHKAKRRRNIALEKEMRKKARERARERTQEKKQARIMCNKPDVLMNLDSCHVRLPGQFELGDALGSQSHNMRSSLDVLYEIDEQPLQEERNLSPAHVEDFTVTSLAFTANWSPPMNFSYNYEFEVGQIPMSELQLVGASWEPYNNLHLFQQ